MIRHFQQHCIRWICLFTMTFATIQCGTIAGTKQLQAFDSEPRGASILVPSSEKKDPLLGTTPFVGEVTRKNRQNFRYALGRKSKIKEIDIDCKYRYGASLGGNLFTSLLLLGNPMVAAGVFSSFFITDLVTGAAFECPDLNITVENVSKKIPKNFCKKVIVAPPKFVDEKLSDLVARQWMANSHLSRKCDTFANYQSSKKIFQYLNIDHRNPIYPAMMTSFFKLKLAKETNASHLVVLEVGEDEKNWIVSFTEIDLFRDDPRQNDVFTFSPNKSYVPKGKYAELSLVEKVSKNTAAQLIAWLPNSITFATGTSSLSETYPNENSRTSTDQVKTFSRLITGWALSNIGHSSAYNIWDYSFILSPSLDFSWQTYEVNSTLVPPTSPLSNFELDFMYLVATYDLGFTVYTPLGGTSFILGLGAGAFHADLGENGTNTTARIVQKASIRHVAFLTQNVYLKVEFYHSETKRPIADTDVIKINGSDSTTVGIGYFFPAWRYWLQDAIF